MDPTRFTVGACLRRWAAETPKKTFAKFGDCPTLTFDDANNRVETIAAGLSDLGVAYGDRVALLMDNSLDMLLAWFAINYIGAVEVPINTASRGKGLSHVLSNSEANVVIADAIYVSNLADIADTITSIKTLVVRGGDADCDLPWHSVSFATLERNGLPNCVIDVCSRDPGAIIYTSGTTGPAKGVVMSHAQMYMFAKQIVDQLEMTSADTYYVCLPLFHANAQFMQVYAALIAGASIELAERFSASNWVKELARSGATVTSLLGIMAQFVYKQQPSHLDRKHLVRRMITIPLPAAIASNFEERFGARCVEAYGMTEICLPMFRPRGESLRPGSCGKVLGNLYDVAICDPDTDLPVADGELGEILVRPRVPFLTMLNYHRMPEVTLDAWRNLWFHTGDLGRRDSEGYYYFIDRISDRIRRRGENVTAIDIESALLEHSGIAEVAVVGVPAPEGEDDIKAYVVMRSGQTIDPVNITEFCIPRMPYFSVPRYLEFVDTLPKTPSGKVMKKELRSRGHGDTVWDREEAGIIITRETSKRMTGA